MSLILYKCFRTNDKDIFQLIDNGNCTEWSAIWSEIKRVIRKSQVWFQTKIARHEVQFPLYYIHFEIYKRQR